MAQQIAVTVYRLGAGNKFGTPRLETIPVPFSAVAIPAANQMDPAIFVYSKIFVPPTWPIRDDLYASESVQSLTTRANA